MGAQPTVDVLQEAQSTPCTTRGTHRLHPVQPLCSSFWIWLSPCSSFAQSPNLPESLPESLPGKDCATTRLQAPDVHFDATWQMPSRRGTFAGCVYPLFRHSTLSRLQWDKLGRERERLDFKQLLRPDVRAVDERVVGPCVLGTCVMANTVGLWVTTRLLATVCSQRGSLASRSMQ